MFKKVADITLVTLVAVFMCATIGLKVASELGAQFPDWMAVGQARSNLEGRDYQVCPTPTVENVVNGEFQSALEKGIADLAPMRDDVILANAAMQRACIEIANAPFSWDCYPTYFDSERLYIPSQDAVTYLPEKLSENRLENLRAFGRNLADSAERHPNMRFVVCVVQAYQDPSVNPAYALTSAPLTPQQQIDALGQGLEELGVGGNVFVVTESYDSLEAYYADYFKTDHHWNHRGAERAYNDIASLLGLKPFEDVGEIEFPGYEYSGATARWGLKLLGERVSDTAHDFAGLVAVDANGNESPYDHRAFLELDGPRKQYSFYDLYYSLAGPLLRGEGAGSCAVVSNSFGMCIAPYIAENYGETQVIADAMNPSRSGLPLSFESQIVSRGCSDVVFVANLHDIAAFAAKNPDFFAG